MDFGKIEYIALDGDGGVPKKLRLTLIGQGDDEMLTESGLAELRRKRIKRIANEAARQGVLLGYRDLSGLLFTSLATVKRDVRCIEEEGIVVPIRGRRKNGNGGMNDKAEGRS